MLVGVEHVNDEYRGVAHKVISTPSPDIDTSNEGLEPLCRRGTLALNLYTFKRVTYPGFVAEHRFRQETRLRPTAGHCSWPLCWLCWFHLQRPAPTAVRTHRPSVCLIAPVGHHSVGSVPPSSAALTASLSHPCRTASCKATDRARRARKPSREHGPAAAAAGVGHPNHVVPLGARHDVWRASAGAVGHDLKRSADVPQPTVG